MFATFAGNTIWQVFGLMPPDENSSCNNRSVRSKQHIFGTLLLTLLITIKAGLLPFSPGEPLFAFSYQHSITLPGTPASDEGIVSFSSQNIGIFLPPGQSHEHNFSDFHNSPNSASSEASLFRLFQICRSYSRYSTTIKPSLGPTTLIFPFHFHFWFIFYYFCKQTIRWHSLNAQRIPFCKQLKIRKMNLTVLITALIVFALFAVPFYLVSRKKTSGGSGEHTMEETHEAERLSTHTNTRKPGRHSW